MADPSLKEGMLNAFKKTTLAVLALFCFCNVASAQSVEPALKAILDRHAETRGGLLKLNALGALHIEGTTRQQRSEYRFVIFKKRPDLIRLSLEDEGAGENLLFGFDGQTGWKRLVVDGEARTETLSADEARVLRLEAALDSPLTNYLENPEHQLSYIGVRRMADTEVYVIEVLDPQGQRSRYYLERGGYDLYQRELLGSDGAPTLITRYRDYREVGDYRFAFTIENFIGGESVSLTVIDELKVNPGLLSFYFKPPR